MKLLTLILFGLLTFSFSDHLNDPINEPLNQSTENSFILKDGFNSKEQLLVNINTELSESSNITLKENGEYNFKLIDENVIKIEDVEYNYFLDEEKLVISFQEASDGPRMEFIKAN